VKKGMEREETNFYAGTVLGPTNSRKENNHISIKTKTKNQKEMV
jgi:hypothetical protein